MKKILAMLLAAMMLLGVGVNALATVGSETAPGENVESTFYFTKEYIRTTGTEALTVFPAESLGFTVTADASNPDDTLITIADQTVDANPDEIAITVPAYASVGNYLYTITENVGTTQGVTYSSQDFMVEVMVNYQADGVTKQRQVVFYKAKPGSATNEKIDTITNRYDTGNLSVSKQVTGNLASTTQLFDIDVEFIASEGKTVLSNITYSGGSDAAASGTITPDDWSATAVGAPSTAKVTIKIKHGETVTFENIPEGVAYTVIEDSKHKDPSEINSGDDSKGYTASDEVLNAREIKCDETSTATIINTKGTNINTGISLDSLPYIIALAVVAVGVVVFLLRRRRREDD